MTKKLSERIAERATAKAQGRNAKNKAQFLSVRNEVEEALGENWTVKDIWETLHEEGAISFSYEAFRKHVNAWKNHKPEPQKNHQQEAAVPQIPKSTELPGFTWNPVANPDELY
jgi:hypothetical protein